MTVSFIIKACANGNLKMGCIAYVFHTFSLANIPEHLHFGDTKADPQHHVILTLYLLHPRCLAVIFSSKENHYLYLNIAPLSCLFVTITIQVYFWHSVRSNSRKFFKRHGQSYILTVLNVYLGRCTRATSRSENSDVFE